MKKISLIPDFLLSDQSQNPIIAVKNIVTVTYDDSCGLKIAFLLDNEKQVNWTFDKISETQKVYFKILNDLQDRKIIIEDEKIIERTESLFLLEIKNFLRSYINSMKITKTERVKIKIKIK